MNECATCEALGETCPDVECQAAAGLPVTCDQCDATSESGWGDTPLCLTCQKHDDPSQVCEEHQRTFEGDACPLDH